jgi:hypothetical protein
MLSLQDEYNKNKFLNELRNEYVYSVVQIKSMYQLRDGVKNMVQFIPNIIRNKNVC